MSTLEKLKAELQQQEAHLDCLIHSAPRAHRPGSTMTPEEALRAVAAQRDLVDRLQKECDA